MAEEQKATRTRKPATPKEPKDAKDVVPKAAVEDGMSIHGKLARIMGKIGKVEKKGHNDHFNYDYVKEADLVEAIRGLLADENIFIYSSILHSEEREVFGSDRNGAQISKGHVTKVVIAHTFADGDTGETFTVKSQGAGHDALDKGLYKAITGAEKYFLMKNFLVATGLEPEEDKPPKDEQQASTKSTRSTTTKSGGKKKDEEAAKPTKAEQETNERGERMITTNQLRRINAMARSLKLDEPGSKEQPELHRIAGVASLKDLTSEAAAILAARLQEAFSSPEALAKLKAVEGGDAAAGQPTGASPPSRETSPPSSPIEAETADATPAVDTSQVADEAPAQEPVDESEQAEAELAREESRPPEDEEGATEEQWERAVRLWGGMDKTLAAIKKRFPDLDAPGLISKQQMATLMVEKMGGKTAGDMEKSEGRRVTGPLSATSP